MLERSAASKKSEGYEGVFPGQMGLRL